MSPKLLNLLNLGPRLRDYGRGCWAGGSGIQEPKSKTPPLAHTSSLSVLRTLIPIHWFTAHGHPPPGLDVQTIKYSQVLSERDSGQLFTETKAGFITTLRTLGLYHPEIIQSASIF